MPDVANIRFNVLRNALYHTARRQWLERVNRMATFLTILLGTAAFGQMALPLGLDARLLALAVAVIGTLQLVFDFGGLARHHHMLQRDYYALLADIEGTRDPDADKLAQWRARMMLITSDEPPTLRAVDARAYNDAIGATGEFDLDQRLAVPLWQRPFAQVLGFNGYTYQKLAERK